MPHLYRWTSQATRKLSCLCESLTSYYAIADVTSRVHDCSQLNPREGSYLVTTRTSDDSHPAHWVPLHTYRWTHGVAKTLARISKNLCWSSLRDDVAWFVAQCTEYKTKKMAGLLCPLPVPHRPWEDLSLDFIMGLPLYHGNSVILVVVDRFSKGIHLGMLPSSHTAHTVASLFMDNVGKIHGLPRSLVSDRDPLLVSKFWQELFQLSGMQLRMSSTYHP